MDVSKCADPEVIVIGQVSAGPYEGTSTADPTVGKEGTTRREALQSEQDRSGTLMGRSPEDMKEDRVDTSQPMMEMDAIKADGDAQNKFTLNVSRIPEEPEVTQLKLPDGPVIQKSHGSSQESPVSSARKTWRKIGNVFRSVMLMNQQVVVSLHSPEQIHREMDQHQRRFSFNTSPVGRQAESPEEIGSPQFRTMKESISTFRQVENFCNHATVGGPDDLRKMKAIYDGHPSRFPAARHR
jgi:hypothetical protein